MEEKIEKIIVRFKKESGKHRDMTAREMLLIKICIEDLLVSRESQLVPSEITMDEVVRLNEMQREDKFHPYTCGNRDNHPVFDGDKGMLVATIHGWICLFCDYKQPIKRGIVGQIK